MKYGLGCLVLFVTLGPVVASSQEAAASTDPFNGTWTLNIEKTKELSGGSSPVHEVITFNIGEDGVQHYQVEIQTDADGPRLRGWYDSKYNEDRFVPYHGEIYSDPGMEVMTVKVDDRTHYRIARTVDGEARYIMMRRLSDDGKSYISAGIMTDGQPGLYRWMDRVE
jgi:hypothetical protein